MLCNCSPADMTKLHYSQTSLFWFCFYFYLFVCPTKGKWTWEKLAVLYTFISIIAKGIAWWWTLNQGYIAIWVNSGRKWPYFTLKLHYYCLCAYLFRFEENSETNRLIIKSISSLPLPDKCTDIGLLTTIKGNDIGCRWEDFGLPRPFFIYSRNSTSAKWPAWIRGMFF